MTAIKASPSVLHQRPALNVLVADDMLGNQRLTMAMLARMGHTGMVASNGRQVLECLARHRFDLLLLDDHMPGMDGREALATLRTCAHPRRRRLPVIMVTANDLPGDREAYLAMGADGHLSKPLRFSELQHELASVLRDPIPESGA